MTKSEKIELQRILTIKAQNIWDSLIEIYPKLAKFDCPTIAVNMRFTRTAGCNHQSQNIIEIAGKFYAKHRGEMLTTILPHEMIHQADWNLFGLSEKKCGHGKKWAEIMVQYGLPANKYHSLEL
jgi:predicted SprT family Zn-dependent metalloprotease